MKSTNRVIFTQNPKPKTGNTCLHGQIWSMDFFSVSTIIVLLLVLFIFSWNFMALRWNNIQSYDEMWITGVAAADALTVSAGQPYGWEDLEILNDSTIEAFGLANSRNILDENKLSSFSNVSASNYTFTKDKLGLRKYEFFANITDLNREQTYYYFGTSPTNLNETVSFDRFMVLDGDIVILRLEVWK